MGEGLGSLGKQSGNLLQLMFFCSLPAEVLFCVYERKKHTHDPARGARHERRGGNLGNGVAMRLEVNIDANSRRTLNKLFWRDRREPLFKPAPSSQDRNFFSYNNYFSIIHGCQEKFFFHHILLPVVPLTSSHNP